MNNEKSKIMYLSPVGVDLLDDLFYEIDTKLVQKSGKIKGESFWSHMESMTNRQLDYSD